MLTFQAVLTLDCRRETRRKDGSRGKAKEKIVKKKGRGYTSAKEKEKARKAYHETCLPNGKYIHGKAVK